MRLFEGSSRGLTSILKGGCSGFVYVNKRIHDVCCAVLNTQLPESFRGLEKQGAWFGNHISFFSTIRSSRSSGRVGESEIRGRTERSRSQCVVNCLASLPNELDRNGGQ